MSEGLHLIACAGERSLERTLLLCGAVARQGGRVVVLTHTPGLCLRRTFFGLEVVVRREDDLKRELLRLEALALARGAHALLLDEPRLADEHAAYLRVLSEQLVVARVGPALLHGAAGELTIDPYFVPAHAACGRWPAPGGRVAPGCYGLAYLPLHPGLRPLRERRRAPAGEVRRVTIVCREREEDHGEGRQDLEVRAVEALSVWRPTLQVTVLCPEDLPWGKQAALTLAVQNSRHDVAVRPLLPEPHLGEELLCDLAIVDDPECAALAAYLGTPAVLLSKSAEAARRGAVLAASGAALHLPSLLPDALPPVLFADLLWSLLADPGRRAALAAGAARAIDGLGAERVAAALTERQRLRSGR